MQIPSPVHEHLTSFDNDMNQVSSEIGSKHTPRSFEECAKDNLIFNSNSGEGTFPELSEEVIEQHAAEAAKEDRVFFGLPV